MKNRITYQLEDTIQVFRLGKTSNKKIAPENMKIVQTYTFSKEQYYYVQDGLRNNRKIEFYRFFAKDRANCLDCPLSSNYGNKKCYTRKFNQYIGFVAMLKSIANEFDRDITNIPIYSTAIKQQIEGLVLKSEFTRFGTYGEPSKHPIELVGAMAILSKSYTGYTHQWYISPEFKQYFMASVHSESSADIAKKHGWRSFISSNEKSIQGATNCPASKESNYKSNCAVCGLCSGQYGKGSKNVNILNH